MKAKAKAKAIVHGVTDPFSSHLWSTSHLMSRHVASGGGRRPCRRVTGTLFGRRKGRVALALQETPRSLPSLVVELALQTHALLRELGNPAGARIVLETERRRGSGAGEGPKRAPLLEEAASTMFCNRRKTGYAVRREATDYDLTVMETLRAVSMGAGVLPVPAAAGGGGGAVEVGLILLLIHSVIAKSDYHVNMLIFCSALLCDASRYSANWWWRQTDVSNSEIAMFQTSSARHF
ncbi:protein MIZU-KUSSEI 1-like [Hordeum vulgare]|nr:protein MIZU-KUSSEI 1-like [Hordeum vulgare]